MIKLYICCLVFTIGSVEEGPDMDIKFYQVVMKIVRYDKNLSHSTMPKSKVSSEKFRNFTKFSDLSSP